MKHVIDKDVTLPISKIFELFWYGMNAYRIEKNVQYTLKISD